MIDISLYQTLFILTLGIIYGYALHKTADGFMWHLIIILTAPLIAVFLGLIPGLLMIGLVGLIEIGVILNYSRNYNQRSEAA